MAGKTYNGEYTGERLSRVAFPMGGMGAGTICLEGTGALSHVSLRHRPEVFNEPLIFAAVCLKGAEGNVARVVEGPVPTWKLFGTQHAANGLGGRSYGLPRFRQAGFAARFPFGTVSLSDADLPVTATITGWSPFEPNDADSASLPVVGLEYTLTNTSAAAVEGVFSYNARNFMALADRPAAVRAVDGGFVLWGGANEGQPHEEGSFCVSVDEPGACVDCAMFRGGWFDPLTILWRDIVAGRCEDRPPYAEGAASPGASVQVPFALAPGEQRTIVVRLSWYVPVSDKKDGGVGDGGTYVPWYAGAFDSIDAVDGHWRASYARLRANAQCFADCFYDSTLPAEALEAVSANLGILKSPTVLRQSDGRLWVWEGCFDNDGCCPGSCTHVWNYAQAIPHLFPALERTLRETEFGPCQDERGHQGFRAALPIRVINHDFHAAADGQLGGIIKVYREWRILGDTDWLRGLWPQVRASLDYCIETWDPEGRGWLEEPHHNTYDIEFWGPDGMCTSFYLGALRAAQLMGEALGDDVSLYGELLARGKALTETELYDGEYFIQKVQWTGLRAPDPTQVQSFGGGYSAEALAVMEREGPKYQYGVGCLSDGVLGEWMAAICGVGEVLDAGKIASHLASIYRYNLKHDLSAHANPQRPTFACGDEGGLLLCTWPKGGALSLPFVYSDEVWTGIEYQVASHLILSGQVEAGLDVVRTCRDRYDGRVRNPFNEYECGHWYGRALASYALLESLGGARYDAVERTLYLRPRIEGDFACFLSTATGYGLVGRRDGQPFLEVRGGTIDVHKMVTD